MMNVLFFLFALLSWGVVEYLAYRNRQLRQYLDAQSKYIRDMQYRGIYLITCRQTNATYCGKTSTNFMARWGQHIRDLNNQQHGNPRLQEEWNRYGADAFEFNVIEILDDDDLIIERETAILKRRAMELPPILNYNVANSRIYPVPAAPDVETVIVERPAPRPSRRRAHAEPVNSDTFSLEDLGLTPEEIELLNQKA